jgi:2-dehydropantoate 2-reductase
MIAIVGVGAIGASVAAPLAARRDDVVCCVRTPLRELVVTTPDAEHRVSPRVSTDPGDCAPVDWLLLATKAHQVEGAGGWLAALVGPHTRLAVLQNGVEHAQRVARWVPASRVVPVVVYTPAEALAPGRVTLRAPARLMVPDDAPGRAFAQLFDGTDVAVDASADFVTESWRKLCINVTGGAIAALAGVPLPEVRHPRAEALARALARECAEVAAAEGALLSRQDADAIAAGAARARTGGRPSTLQDRMAGRSLEADARNGAVPRIGARHGIPAPANAAAAELLGRAHRLPGDLLPALEHALERASAP